MLLFTWPYNFDVSLETKSCFQGMSVRSFTWRVMPYSSSRLNNSNFKREVWYSFWRNQKFVTSGTACTKPLRMCSFR